MPESRTIAALYVVFATLALLLIAPAMPPFQNPDEPNHIYRAYQVGHFGLLSEPLPNGHQGAWVDAALLKSHAPFDKIPFNQAAKVTRNMYAPQEWGGLAPVGLPNTGAYPPLFYLPAAAALRVAQMLRLSVLHGVMAARIATGAATIAIATVAVLLADTAAPWLFAVLLLPMSLAQTAAVSQDGLLFACTALAASLCLRLRRIQAQNRELLAAACVLALVGMARPPYAGFALVLLAARAPLPARLQSVAVALAPVMAWSLIAAPHIGLPELPSQIVDPTAQAQLLLHSPWRIFLLFGTTLHSYGSEVLQSFIGRPGWMDVYLPAAYITASCVMLALTGLVTFGAHDLPRLSWAGLTGILAACAGIVFLEYLTWTSLGAPAVNGLQGRYFIPPALMLATVLASSKVSTRHWGAAVCWTVLLFPVVSIPVTLHAILLRYYF